MNKKSSVSLGPGAPSLILIFVALSMSVLGMLSLMSARNDLHLSERSVQVVETVYALNERAEESRRELDRMLAQCAAEAERLRKTTMSVIHTRIIKDAAQKGNLKK